MRHLRQLPPHSESHGLRSPVQLFKVATARAIDETTELDTVTVYAPGVHNPFA